MLYHVQSGGTARYRMAPIATHYEIGMDLDLSAVIPRHKSRDAIVFSNQIGCFVLHEQLKGGEFFAWLERKSRKSH
jgi:hypothetical protein